MDDNQTEAEKLRWRSKSCSAAETTQEKEEQLR